MKKNNKTHTCRTSIHNLYRYIVLTSSLASICCTGMAICALDPFQEMMKHNDAYANVSDQGERRLAISQLVGYGISWCLTTGAFVGPIYNVLGPKLTASLGVLLHTFGYIALFFTHHHGLYHISVFCFGLAFQCILNSHLSVGCLFPEAPNLVIAILGSAPDISLFVPAFLLKRSLATHERNPVQHVVKQYLLYIVLPALALDLIFLPFHPFKSTSPSQASAAQDDPKDLGCNEKNMNSETSCLVETSSTRGKTSHGVQGRMVYFSDFSLSEQLMTPDYWIFLMYSLVVVFRGKYFSGSIRYILEEIEVEQDKVYASRYTNFYNMMIPYGFIPAVLWGALVDYYGIVNLMMASNVAAILYIGLALVPFLHIQPAMVVIFIIYQSFVLGQVSSFLICVYGFKNLISLQSIFTSIIGALCLSLDAFLYPYILKTLIYHYNVNLFVLILSFPLFGFPLYLRYLHRKRDKRAIVDTLGSGATHMSGFPRKPSILPPTNIYERESIAQLSQDQENNDKTHCNSNNRLPTMC